MKNDSWTPAHQQQLEDWNKLEKDVRPGERLRAAMLPRCSDFNESCEPGWQEVWYKEVITQLCKKCFNPIYTNVKDYDAVELKEADEP